MFKNFVNNKNLKKYRKFTEKVNNLANEYQKNLNVQDIPRTLQDIKNSSLSNHEKTLRAIALAKNAALHVLGMTYYDVQIMGALALTDGTIAEMKTGEGKTLTCSAAVASNYVLGFNTHVVTANEYLAVRDLETLKPLYDFLGISSSYNISTLEKDEKRLAYNSDVMYSVATELGFDFLKDNLVFKHSEKVQVIKLSHTKAIIDEADFILIDEARTPLIISSPISETIQNKHQIMIQIIDNLERMEKEPSIQAWAEPVPGDFWLDEKIKRSYISEDGYKKIEELAVQFGLISKTSDLYLPENAWILRESHNTINAKYLYIRDKDYIVRYNEIVIIDSNTGRLSEGRTWSDGLNQAIEAKEGLEIKAENASSGTISVQNYFKLYNQISGMSGTIMTSSEEFEFIYNTSTTAIPKNRPEKRVDHPDRLFASISDKYKAVIKEISKRKNNGQPVLVGTTSVQESEIISNLLNENNIPHNVLNAKNHHYEAQIIAQAGKPSTVTVATSMAGRGTDIILGGNQEAFKQIISSQLDDIQNRREFFNICHNSALQVIDDYENNIKQQVEESIQKQILQNKQLTDDANNIIESLNSTNEQLATNNQNNLNQLLDLQASLTSKNSEKQETSLNSPSDESNLSLNNLTDKNLTEIDISDDNISIYSHGQDTTNETTTALNSNNVENKNVASDNDITDIMNKIQNNIAVPNEEKNSVQELISEFKKTIEDNQQILNSSYKESDVQIQNQSVTVTAPTDLNKALNNLSNTADKLNEDLKNINFPQQMLDETAEIKKFLNDKKDPIKQDYTIYLENFVRSGYDEDTSTKDIIPYQQASTQILMLFHPHYYTHVINQGPQYFHRLLNILENTFLKAQASMDTNIKTWKETVLKAGGLCVIGCSRNESRRIDNQIIGRAGRQGDPGESLFFLSLEDDWIRIYCENRLFSYLKNQISNSPEKYIMADFLSSRFEKIQANQEAQNYGARKYTFQFDSSVDDARQGFLGIRNSILENPQHIKHILKNSLLNKLKPISHQGFFEHFCDQLIKNGLDKKNITISEVQKSLFELPIASLIEYANLYLKDPENEHIIHYLERDEEISHDYKEKLEQEIDNKISLLSNLELEELSIMSLQSLDQLWTSILSAIDEMQLNVGLRQLAQKNPIYEFKNLCYQYFQALINNFQSAVIDNYLTIIEIRKQEELPSSEDDITEGILYDDSITINALDYEEKIV